jgi:alpha-beta hydrolase superfamily lysophospholipase
MKFIFKILILVSLLSSCTSLIYQPDRYLWGDPRSNGVEFKEYIVRSFDGTRLLFWDLLSKDKDPENLVLMFHGNAQNMSAHMFNLLWLSKYKTDVITFDYRGYGLSEGTPYPKGVTEDGLKALQVAYDKFKAGKYKRFIIYTQSLGGYIALRALEEVPWINEVNLLVLDSTFRDPQEVARSKVGFMGYLVSSEYTAHANLLHITMPTLVIHAKNDPVVNYKFGKAIYEAIPSKSKQFWEIENGFHSDIFFVENGKYRNEFLKLLK